MELRIELEDNLILIVRRIDRRDLPGRISAPKRFLDLALRDPLSGNAHARSFVPVQNDLELRILELQVAADIAKISHRAQPFLELRRGAIELGCVGALQRKLIQTSAEPAADPNHRRIL